MNSALQFKAMFSILIWMVQVFNFYFQSTFRTSRLHRAVQLGAKVRFYSVQNTCRLDAETSVRHTGPVTLTPIESEVELESKLRELTPNEALKGTGQ